MFGCSVKEGWRGERRRVLRLRGLRGMVSLVLRGGRGGLVNKLADGCEQFVSVGERQSSLFSMTPD